MPMPKTNNFYYASMLLICVVFTTSWVTSPSVYKEKVFTVYTRDSITMDVELVYDNDQLPSYYYSHIRTPVCEDGLCDLLVIDIYWNLLGDFSHYQTIKGRPLTKFDHEEFSAEDHQKLHKILEDKRSLLGENELYDLIDERTKLVSDEVDAVTGATKKAVKKAVVSGAVYSTYVLWHIANGEISERIPPHTQELWNEALLKKFLTSDNYDYIYYALDQLEEPAYDKYQNEIMRLLNSKSNFVSLYTLDKLPQKILRKKVWQSALAQKYALLNYRTQLKLLERLSEISLTRNSLEILGDNFQSANQKQLEKLLSLYISNAKQLKKDSLEPLELMAEHDNPKYAEQALKALQQIRETNTRL